MAQTSNSNSPATGADQWLRKCSLLVLQGSSDPSSATGNAIDLSEFRIRFHTFQAEADGRPPWAWIRVTNLAADTEQKFVNEFTAVVLQAGYLNGRFGVIFRGTIKEFRRGHETVTDTFLDIYAGDGDIAHNFSAMNETLAAGWTHDTAKKAALDEYARNGGPQVGYDARAISALGPNVRGQVMWGMTHRHITRETRALGQVWLPINGKISIVPFDGYKPGEAVKLSSATGLIGWPEQTPEGIKATCLLNPAITVQDLVQIDNKDINYSVAPGGGFTTPAIGGGTSGQGNSFAPVFLQPVTSDGYYRALVVEHHGDTRGNEWYTEILALAIDMSQKGAAQGETGVDDQNLPVPPPAGTDLPTGDKPDNDPTSPFSPTRGFG
jgi:hypothetical protein